MSRSERHVERDRDARWGTWKRSDADRIIILMGDSSSSMKDVFELMIAERDVAVLLAEGAAIVRDIEGRGDDEPDGPR